MRQDIQQQPGFEGLPSQRLRLFSRYRVKGFRLLLFASQPDIINGYTIDIRTHHPDHDWIEHIK
jgi:hypothetical protein